MIPLLELGLAGGALERALMLMYRFNVTSISGEKIKGGKSQRLVDGAENQKAVKHGVTYVKVSLNGNASLH